jgi:hypothetical protein
MGMSSDHLSPTLPLVYLSNLHLLVMDVVVESIMEEISFLFLMYTILRSVLDAPKICSRISKEKQLNLSLVVK